MSWPLPIYPKMVVQRPDLFLRIWPSDLKLHSLSKELIDAAQNLRAVKYGPFDNDEAR